jgi:hypothetical protein
VRPLLGVERVSVSHVGCRIVEGIGPEIELREAVFGLPEQAGQEAQRIFVAGANEVTLIGSLIEVGIGRSERGTSEVEVNPIKGRLGVASREIGQELGQASQPIRRDRPGRLILLANDTGVQRTKVAPSAKS